MFTFTNLEKTPNISVLCGCGRMYLQEEMYCCIYCKVSLCRYCCIHEIHSYFCKTCTENNYVNDTIGSGSKYKCGNCFECPLCKNNLQLATMPDQASKFYLFCHFCFWDSKSIKLVEEKVESLLAVNKGKDNIDPKLQEFWRVQTIFKEQQTEVDKSIKILQKLKRKSISLMMPVSKIREHTKKHFTISDIEAASKERESRMLMASYSINKPNIKGLKLEEKWNHEDKRLSILKNAEIYTDFYSNKYESLEAELKGPFDPNELTSVEQRLNFSMMQPALTKDLAPKEQLYLARKTKKCRHCSKFVVKQEKTSNTIEFKMAYFLMDYSPKIMIKAIEHVDDKHTQVKLVFLNKTPNLITVSLEQLDEETLIKKGLCDVLNLSQRKTFILQLPDDIEIQKKTPAEAPKGEAQNPTSKKIEEVTLRLERSRTERKEEQDDKENKEAKENREIVFGLKVLCSSEVGSDKTEILYSVVFNLGKRS